ncbi:MAG: hypothetical protein DRR19_06750 [Candidatus Parabeggiatoa sp. nov. 1]|nr:MAG: hypothetical protein DRR19_06750 [Gammaproteobacteria bacterium]
MHPANVCFTIRSNLALHRHLLKKVIFGKTADGNTVDLSGEEKTQNILCIYIGFGGFAKR